MQYGISKSVNLPFEQAIEKVTDELKKEGFGVLTTIDVKETLKKKLNVNFSRYVILGACNPPFAYQALQVEDEIGLLLPCNIIVYEKGDAIHVSAFNPAAMTALIQGEKMQQLSTEVSSRLERVIAAM